MRYAVISDIHSNLPALRTWIDNAPSVDAVWCLGDVVGYAAEPNECIQLLTRLNVRAWVPGNHDLGALGKISRDTFNYEGRLALGWTGTRLTPASRRALAGLALTARPLRDVTLVHASPRDPVWEYLFDCADATGSTGFLKTHICFFGHTHVPTIFRLANDGCESVPIELRRPIPLANGRTRWLVNPGSLGQPRDRDPRLSYLIFDDVASTVEFHRLAYPLAETQARIVAAGLPEMLARRLEYGL